MRITSDVYEDAGKAAIVRRIDQTVADAFGEGTFEEVLHLLARETRLMIGTHQCAISYVPDGDFQVAIHTHSFSKKYEKYNTYDVVPTGGGIWGAIVEKKVTMRMTEDELVSHPRWKHFSDLKDERGLEHPPMRGWLAVSIVGQTGAFLGVVQLSDKYEGDFSQHDEDQLARLATLISPAFELQHVNQELQRHTQSLRQMSKVFMDAADPIVIEDLSGRVQELNRDAQRTYGWTREELIGQSIKLLVPPERHAQADELLERCRRGEDVRNVEGLRWNKAKEAIPVLLTLSLLTDEKGESVGIATIAKDITELNQAAEELRQRAEELARADRQKDEFLAVLGHELRNPLAAIMGITEVLKQSGSLDPESTQILGILERQTWQLNQLVSDLLDIARITSGRIELHRDRMDVRSVVRHVLETFHAENGREEHKLIVSLPAQPLEVEGDALRLEQVVSNLVENAAKYTEASGKISVSAQQEAEEIVIRVRDTGIGIPAEHLPRLFDGGIPASQAGDCSKGGLGMGLRLVRRLVELHGGSVSAESCGEGKGSEFTVRLPAAEREAEADRQPPTPAREPATGQPRRRVLVIDDNPDVLETYRTVLKLWGHEVYAAETGPSGIEAARKIRPEVVLVDIGLPGMDGCEVAKRLRAEPDLEPLILVAVTGYGQPKDRQRSEQAGFNHHLVKPDVLEDLATILKQR